MVNVISRLSGLVRNKKESVPVYMHDGAGPEIIDMDHAVVHAVTYTSKTFDLKESDTLIISWAGDDTTEISITYPDTSIERLEFETDPEGPSYWVNDLIRFYKRISNVDESVSVSIVDSATHPGGSYSATDIYIYQIRNLKIDSLEAFNYEGTSTSYTLTTDQKYYILFQLLYREDIGFSVTPEDVVVNTGEGYTLSTIVDFGTSTSNSHVISGDIERSMPSVMLKIAYTNKADLEDITFTENGSYTSEEHAGFREVTVAVPDPVPSNDISITTRRFRNSLGASGYAYREDTSSTYTVSGDPLTGTNKRYRFNNEKSVYKNTTDHKRKVIISKNTRVQTDTSGNAGYVKVYANGVEVYSKVVPGLYDHSYVYATLSDIPNIIEVNPSQEVYFEVGFTGTHNNCWFDIYTSFMVID